MQERNPWASSIKQWGIMIYLTPNLSSGLVFNKPMNLIKAEAYVYVYICMFGATSDELTESGRIC